MCPIDIFKVCADIEKKSKVIEFRSFMDKIKSQVLIGSLDDVDEEISLNDIDDEDDDDIEKKNKKIGGWTYAGHWSQYEGVDFYFEEKCSICWIQKIIDCVKPTKVLYLRARHIHDDLWRVYYSYDKNKFDRNDYVINESFIKYLNEEIRLESLC